MNSENKTNNKEKGVDAKSVPPVSSRVVTYKKAATLKKTQAPTVTVGKVKKPQPNLQQSPAQKINTDNNTDNMEQSRGSAYTKPQDSEKIHKMEEKKQAHALRKKKRALNSPKKRRITQGVKPIKIVVGVVVVVALIIGGIIFGLYSSGRRYQTVKFTDVVTATKYNIVFIGKVDDNGFPLSGTLTYDDGSKATIGRNESNVVRVEYDNGWVYEGDFTSFHRNGYGTLTLSNGDIYKGNFFYDRMWGNGEYRYAKGDVYTGEFENNVKCGDGIYTFANGNKYVGKFENDLRNGEGVFTYANGSVYEGAFVNDIKNDDNAKMSIVTPSGGVDVYVGPFVNDLREGIGTYNFANGDTYEGEFRGNYISGHGKYTWVSGRSYEGEFLNGAIVKDSSVYPYYQ